MRRNYPNDNIRFVSGATILESENKDQIGWSLRRIFQKRGNVVITDQRIMLKVQFLTPMSVIYLILVGLSIYAYVSFLDLISLFLGAYFLLLLMQRIPYHRQISYTEIKDAKLSTVRGITGRGSLLTLLLSDKSMNIVPAQLIPEEIFDFIRSQIMSRQINSVKE